MVNVVHIKNQLSVALATPFDIVTKFGVLTHMGRGVF